ncbi:MAG TPA: NAD(P)H-dependent oxidoreductase [Gaiellales bacterium]|nr:NAD(P)H-dependent oxidoreductase [Gaiellales bacterium]
MRVLALSGSLRRDSLNARLLRAAEELAPAGVEFAWYSGLDTVPPFRQELEHDQPEQVHELRRRIEAADAVLIATPEYNGSIPGQLKNALDWVSRPLADSPFRGRPTAVIGASTSAYGAMWAQAELRKVLGLMGARVIESGLAVPRAEDHLDGEGHLLDADMRDRLADILAELEAAAEPAAVVAA